VSELHEDLDRALRAVPIGEAPVEAAKRQGRRLRARRRVTLLAGSLAVMAAAIGYPALTRTAAAPSAAATGPEHASAPYQGDPVLTDGAGGKTTEGPNGLVGSGDVIATGTIGSDSWQATVTPEGGEPLSSTGACPGFSFSVSFSKGGPLGSYCPSVISGGNSTDAANPVAFTGSASDGTKYAIYGQVSDQVADLIVTFTDGQQLKLVPVIADGIRYFTWVAPESMTVASVVAHLGGPYDTNGQTETAVPLDLPGQVPVFGLTQKPGQAGPPRAAKVIVGGTTAGASRWTVTAYEGPWGTCFVSDTHPSDVACVPAARLATTAFLGQWVSAMPDTVTFGSAAPGVALVRVTLSDETTATVRPVRVGNEDLFAVPSGGNEVVMGWTAYDASGKQVGAGTVPLGSLPS
jgi:hypothetical protein